MDSVTQAVLGASIQASLMGRWQGRKALLFGAALATVPDLDVFLDYGDALSNMTYHRSFSHSLFVLTALAAVLTTAIRWRWPKAGYTSARLFITLWLVLITHPLLDAFTSYGTQLWWPLSVNPSTWSSIFIIDPLYTLPLLIPVLWGLRRRTPFSTKPFTWGLALSSVYLASTLVSKYYAEQPVRQLMAEQHIQGKLFSTPTPFNSLLWRVLIVEPEQYHETYVSLLDQHEPSWESYPRGAKWQPIAQQSAHYQRLQWFTSDLTQLLRSGDQLVVSDLRMGNSHGYAFNFAIANKDHAHWKAILPSRWKQSAYNPDQLKHLWQRIWQEPQPHQLTVLPQ